MEENRIKELREERGLSMDKLGELAGTGATTINKLEKGELRLSVYWMRRVAPALGVTPADLLSDADNPNRVRDENEVALLDILRRLKPENQTKVLSRTHLLWRAQEGLITEAEMEPNLQGILEPLAPRQPTRRKNKRKNPLPFESTE